jgi:alanyl-tRNA synthetase
VFTDDDEAFALWEKYVPGRVLRFGEEDNFWAMGETGPCGPCSELHYFRGNDLSKNTAELVNGPGDDTLEIWNLVFMQFDRDASGRMTPLPKPSVDTGAGLERITAILQDKNNNFDTDLFRPIIASLELLSGRKYAGGMAVEDAPFRVLADHARAATMLMADGVMPSNEGRGYVLRRIIRRALRYARHLGLNDEPVLTHLVAPVTEIFRGVYFGAEDGVAVTKRVQDDLRIEEERFVRTLSTGIDLVGEQLERLRRSGVKQMPGPMLFQLYDTYGIPADVVEEMASDEGLSVDRAGFEAAMEEQRTRSRSVTSFEAADASVYEKLALPDGHSQFRGYPEHDFVRLSGARIVGLLRDGAPVQELNAGEEGEAVADRTVFYPEGGGQVGDAGTWRWEGGEAEVLDTQRPAPGVIAHRVRVKVGTLRVGGPVDMEVPEWTRRRTQANHTGTHLLHAALRRVLGDSARQMGSLVAPDRLRFDYSAATPTTPEQLAEIDRLVNEEILRDSAVSKDVMSMDQAKAKGAIAFFGEKYGDRVRVVDVPGFSTELCGGCHVPRTGEIGAFKIVSDKGLAAGVRRLEAVTSLGAVDLLRRDEEILNALSGAVQAPRESLVERWAEREERLKALEREVTQLKLKLASGDSGGASDSLEVNGVRLVTRIAAGLSVPELRNLSDTLRAKVKSGVVVVGSANDGKALGGSGGGKAELAQAGGKDEARLPAALKEAEAALRELPAGT